MRGSFCATIPPDARITPEPTPLVAADTVGRRAVARPDPCQWIGVFPLRRSDCRADGPAHQPRPTHPDLLLRAILHGQPRSAAGVVDVSPVRGERTQHPTGAIRVVSALRGDDDDPGAALERGAQYRDHCRIVRGAAIP